MTNKDIEDKIDEQTLYEAIEKDIVLGQNHGKRLLKAYRSQLENEARIDELNRLDTNYWGDDDTDIYLNEMLTPYIENRIATLNKENEQ